MAYDKAARLLKIEEAVKRDGINLEDAYADRAFLLTEFKRLHTALTEVAEHPGPNASEEAWYRVAIARDAINPETSK